MSQWKRHLYPIGAAFLFLLVALPFLSAYADLRQAETARREKDYTAASELYARAARVLFWRADLREQAGISASLGGDHSPAIEYLEKTSSHSEEGWFHLALSHFRLGNIPPALSAIERGLRAYDSPSLYGLLALIHRAQKDWEAELDALENLVRLGSEDAYIHYRLGLLLTLFSPEDALPALTRASSLNPEVDPAAQTLRAALALSSTQPDDSQKLLTIGRAFGLVQEWELALAAFTQAVERDPKNAEAWAWLGEAHQQMGGDGSAELDRALSLNRTNPTVHALRALYWSRRGDYEQALDEYLLASKYDAKNPAWQAGIGETYVRLGDLVAALAAYQRAVEFAPGDAAYWTALAVFCAENGIHLEEIGLPAAQQAVTLAPDDPLALDALGWSYYSMGRHASAEQTLLHAIDLAPDHFPAHIHLAMNYLAQGNRAAAFNALTFVRDADLSGIYRETALWLLEQYFP